MEQPSNKTDRQKQPSWLTWLCYIFLIVGFGLTFFHDQLATTSGLPLVFLQIVGILTLLIGIALFLVVRDPSKVDRAAAYRTLLGREGEPPANSSSEDKDLK
jgi:hypothetical protein